MNPLFLSAVAFAQNTPGGPAAPGGPAGAGQGDLARMAITIGLLIMVFYFIILRPQKSEQRKREELLNSIDKGDQVITSGGIHGSVESVDTAKGIVTLGVAPKVSMKFSRSAIVHVTKKKSGKEGEAES